MILLAKFAYIYLCFTFRYEIPTRFIINNHFNQSCYNYYIWVNMDNMRNIMRNNNKDKTKT